MIDNATSEVTTLNYQELIERFPWLLEREQDCILSPDSDGLLCGLFMSHFLGWKVRGYYDGKILLLEKGKKAQECVFLDMEILRRDVRSVGQHMVVYNGDFLPSDWRGMNSCLSANDLRSFDAKNNFPRKYPLATIHLLTAIAGQHLDIDLPTSAICPLLYTDGTFKNLFNYPENCLDWLGFLGAEKKSNPLHAVFFNDHYTIASLMTALKELFAELHFIADGKRGGDKIRFSNSNGELINFDTKSAGFTDLTRKRAEHFLQLLANKTSWQYSSSFWVWKNFAVSTFAKGSIVPSNARYSQLMAQEPLSMAVTSTRGLEYTLDPDNSFYNKTT